MEPEATSSVGTVKKRLKNIQTKINKNKYKEGPSTRKNVKNITKLDTVQKDIQSDFDKLMKKVDTIFEILGEIFDEVEDLDQRVTKIESKPDLSREVEALGSRILEIETKSNCSYSKVTTMSPASRNNNADENENRLDKLEYSSSEEERKKRLLHVMVTHPTIDKENTDSDKLKDLMRQKFFMEQREIDENLVVFKGPREHSVIVKFSDRKFKLFFYKAKKAIRPLNSTNPSSSETNSDRFFINDYLTRYNYKILMAIKRLKNENSPWPFKSLYSYEGKVYVKHGLVGAESTVHIKYPSMINKVVLDAKRDTSVTGENNARIEP